MSIDGERYTYTKRDLVNADRVAGWGGALGFPHPELEQLGQKVNEALYEKASMAVMREYERIMQADYLPKSWHTLSFSMPGSEQAERVALIWNLSLTNGGQTLSVIHNQVVPDTTGIAEEVMRTSMWVFDEVPDGREGLSYRYSEVYQAEDGEWEWPDGAPRIEVEEEVLTLYLHGKHPSEPQEFMPAEDDGYPKTQGHIEALNGLAEVLKFCTGGTYDERVRGCITERGY